MLAKKRNSKWLSIVLLSLIFTVLIGCDNDPNGQVSKKATGKTEPPDYDEINRTLALIKSGADVNTRNIALIKASQNGFAESVKLLLEAGADVNAAHEIRGITPLYVASHTNNTEVGVRVLEPGEPVFGKVSVTPLWIGSYGGHTEIVELLLGAGADINAAYKAGVTPLWVSSQNGHSEIVKLLLKAGADVNAAHKTDGISPLYIASQNGYVDVVELLLENEADVNAKAHLGEKVSTSLSVAKLKGKPEIVKLLKEYGAKE